MKNDMSVFTLGYKKSWYLLHPLKFIKEVYWDCRNFIHRGRYGFGYCDVWGMDQYLIKVIPKMLRYLAKHGNCYPGSEPFDTPEKYDAWLIKLATDFEKCNIEDLDAHNEFAEDYYKVLKRRMSKKEELTVKEKILEKKYLNRNLQLQEQNKDNIIKAYKELAENHEVLWN